MCDHPCRVGQCGEQVPGDPQRRLLPAAPGDLASNDTFEPCPAQAPGAVQVAAVAVQDHGQRRGPGAGPKRLPGGPQRGRPHTLQQVADLLDLGDVGHDQLLTTRAQVPESAPGLIDRLRDVATQLRGQPGDQYRVLLIGLVERQVLAAPGPGGLDRLHAHERHRPVRGQLAQHPPPVPGRLTRDRDPGPALHRGPLGRPVQRRPEVPRLTPERATSQHPRVVIADHDHLLLVGEIDPHDRVADRHQLPEPGQPRVAVAITPRDTNTVVHERPPYPMGNQARQTHQEDVPTS